PALHRFPGSMAGKVQALCAAIATDYGNDAARVWTDATDGRALQRGRGRLATDYGNDAAGVWTDATDGRDLEARLRGLPGFGEMKTKSVIAVLGNRFGVRPPGSAEVAPTWPTLGDVDSAAALAAYQAGKRAKKAADRAAKGG